MPSTPRSTTIEEALRDGETVQLAGFGKFHVAQYTGRPGVNPRTGERIDVPTTAVPRFTAGVRLRAGRALTASFAERLVDAVARRESQIVLGLDPDPAALWPQAAAAAVAAHRAPAAQRAGRAVLEQCRLLIEATAGVRRDQAAAGLLRAPRRPRLGRARRRGRVCPRGRAARDRRRQAWRRSRDRARLRAGAGRRDRDRRGRGAAASAPTRSRPTRCSGEMRSSHCSASGAGVFVLVRTSNPGAADVQDLLLADGAPLWERLARLVDELGDSGSSHGFSDVGAVIGATRPEHLERARELMPRTIFLLPGVGAQGGRAEDLGAGLRARAGGRTGDRLAFDRQRPRAGRRRSGRRRGGRGAAPARGRLGARLLARNAARSVCWGE